MLELHDNSKLNLQNIDFTYPEDSDTHSLEQLKQYEGRLSQTKDILLEQQIKLKRVLQNVKKMKEGKSFNFYLNYIIIFINFYC